MRHLTLAFLLFALCRCGIQIYPGQPGVVTDGYSKIDLEFLDAEGLWVYETSYDNRTGGKGVGAVITKLYPNAQTYTASSRTNADGAFYWSKGQYEGATVQMISIPRINQVLMPPNSKVTLMLTYEQSVDEIDDRNIAEYEIFGLRQAPAELRASALAQVGLKFRLLRAGTLLPNGSLSYELVAAEVGAKKFAPSKTISLQTNFMQNGVHLNLASETRLEMIHFLEEHFPKGYKGEVKFHLKNSQTPFAVRLGLHSLKTAEAAGVQIIRNASL